MHESWLIVFWLVMVAVGFVLGVGVGKWTVLRREQKQRKTCVDTPGTPIPLTAFYSRIAALADTDKMQINAAAVSRVMRTSFDVLAAMQPVDAWRVVNHGISRAAARRQAAEESEASR